MYRCGALLNFTNQNVGEQNPIYLYTKCGSANDLVMLFWCTELPYHMHSGVWQGCTFTLIPNTMGSYHGQILIEKETDSLWAEPWAEPVWNAPRCTGLDRPSFLFLLRGLTWTGCKPDFVLPMPSTVVTAKPCMEHTGARQAFTEKWLKQIKKHIVIHGSGPKVMLYNGQIDYKLQLSRAWGCFAMLGYTSALQSWI